MAEEKLQRWYDSKLGQSLGKGFEYVGKGLEYIGFGVKWGLIVLAAGYGIKSCTIEENRFREVELNIQRAVEEKRTQTIENLLQRFDTLSSEQFRQLCVDLDLTIPKNKQTSDQ